MFLKLRIIWRVLWGKLTVYRGHPNLLKFSSGSEASMTVYAHLTCKDECQFKTGVDGGEFPND